MGDNLGLVDSFNPEKVANKITYEYMEHTLIFRIFPDEFSYETLNKLLNNRNALIVDDTNKYGVLNNYIEIKKEDETITVRFVNKMGNLDEKSLLVQFKEFLNQIIAVSYSENLSDSKYSFMNYFKGKEKKLGVRDEEVFK